MSLSLPLLPKPRRPLLRKRRQLESPSSMAASPKRVCVRTSSSHSFACPILLPSPDLQLPLPYFVSANNSL